MHAVLLALCVSLTQACMAQTQSQSNVLVVLADDLGVDVVTAYGEGAAPPPTPNLDALAQRGVLFRNAWAYPSCSPARASILTGRYPFRTTVGRWIRHANNVGPAVGTVRADEWTLPEVLDRSGAGYAHAAIGKWHVHDSTFGTGAPMELGGFSHFTGFLAGQLPDYTNWPRVQAGIEQNSTTYATTQQTDDAIAWIQQQSAPWLCYLAYNEPHIPFHVPPAHLHTQNVNASSSNRAKYKAMIEALDTEIGRLLQSLGPATLANTHIVFLGDNGSVQNMAEPPFDPARAKGSPYEGGLNVPLIYAGPAVTAPGREVTALCCAVDVFATVLDFCGAGNGLPGHVAVDGISLVPYLANTQQQPLRQYAFSEEFTGNTWPAPNTNGHACIRDDRYKLIHRYTGGGDELFDLQIDPFENNNLLSGSMTQPQLLAYQRLIQELGRLRTPRARCSSFGTGCTGSVGVPQAACSGVPAFGQSYQVGLQAAAPASWSVLVTGFSESLDRGQPLPIDLALLGAGSSCMQWVSLDHVALTRTDATGAAGMPWSIPSTLALMELALFHSWFVFDASAPNNSLGIVTSNAISAILGL